MHRRRCLHWALVGPTSCLGSTDPVFVTRDAQGRLSYSNRAEHAGSVLWLTGNSPEVLAFRRHYRAGQASLAAGGQRQRPAPRSPALLAQVDRLVDAAARRFAIDADLIRAVISVESNFDPVARSPAGAVGLMQLMPATARRFGVRDRADPEQNIQAGAQYLRLLLDLFDGDVRLALAGYNAGEGNVIKHGRRIPPFAETQAYVPAVISAWRSLAATR
jgi:soluble lytic murein transglycosylase-like protein